MSGSVGSTAWGDECSSPKLTRQFPSDLHHSAVLHNPGVKIRPLQASDHRALLDIYNHYVVTSPCTFDTEPFTLASRRPWFEQFDQQRWQCWVAVEGRDHDDADGAAEAAEKVLGYACSARFKPKPAYLTSVEASVYTHPRCRRSRLGHRVVPAPIRCARRTRRAPHLRRHHPAERGLRRLTPTVRLRAGRPLHRSRLQIRPLLGCRLVPATLR